MTIRIDRIERRGPEGQYTWHIEMKGLHGEGTYCRLRTNEDGYGLSWSVDGLTWTELLHATRFHAHAGLDASQVAHRVAACLVAIGWGPEDYADRESITGGTNSTVRRSSDHGTRNVT